MTRFNEKNANYVDGSMGGALNTLLATSNVNTSAMNRYNSGKKYGESMVAYLIASLHRTDGVIDEKIRLVTHSMGGSFGKGIVAAIMEYLKNNPELCQGLSIDEYDFDPYQAGSLKAADNVFTYQASHIGGIKDLFKNGILANERQKELPDKNYKDDSKASTSHSINSFIHLINSLSEGTYKWNGTQWVKQ